MDSRRKKQPILGIFDLNREKCGILMEKYNIDICILTNNSILLHICQYIPENVIFIEVIVNR